MDIFPVEESLNPEKAAELLMGVAELVRALPYGEIHLTLNVQRSEKRTATSAPRQSGADGAPRPRKRAPRAAK